MSHELRTPLNSILILAKLIAENREGNLSSKQVEFADVIHNSGNDLLKLINEILDLTKIEAGKLSLEIQQFKLKRLYIESLFNELAREKNIDFSINYDEKLPTEIVSDQFRIEQILKNLLSNAFKFTQPEGRVTLDIFIPPAGTTFQNPDLRDSKEVVAFAIRDTGIGISEEDQKTIFDAFRQADSSITRKFGGTGLGLSICKELAQILGGEIKVESKVGTGSCFTLYIPNKVEKVEEHQVEEINIVQDLKIQIGTKQIVKEAEKLIASDEAQSILIIEDDKGFAKILADFAKGKKIEPVLTHLGMKGFELAKQIRPSAILLDIQLPDISGWEVLKKLKEDPTTRYIPVHIMSAYDLNPYADEYSKENYLPKPVSLENLDKAFFKINSKNKNEVKKVLIVEDNKVESNAVKELLLAHELNSEIANSGEEAFEKLHSDHFDCIILDISLPGMGGYEILEKLKSDKKLKSIPVIVYSGKSFSEEEKFKLKKFVNAIVIKTDYSYKRLLDEVKLFLHKVQEKLPVQEQSKLYRTDQSLANVKVLIVDDDSRNTYSLYNAFEAESMNIITASNGVEALKQLDANPDIQIILMDIMMPEMDGLECTKSIRNNPTFTGIPIIALTAKAMKEDKEKCLEAGASDYVTKPVNIDKLLSLMRVWVNRNENIIML
ncbi:hypothetical protein BH23BAC1_BH23BAC1_12560 [soil metagenome]